jgi:hypothetical protein
MNWMVTINKLDPEQRVVLDNLLKVKNSHWIRGFAGSGKSILLIHSLRETLVTNPQATACVVAFTHSLKDMLQSGLPDNSRHIPVMTYHEFKSIPRRYDYIFVDEVQDLEPNILTLLQSSCSKLIMAGDEEQSIYEQRVSPEFIEASTNPSIHSLSIVHRLTEKLRKIVATILPKSKVHSARQGKPTADVKITLANASKQEDEMRWVWQNAQRFTRAGDPVCVLFSKHRLVQDFITFVCNETRVGTPSFKNERGQRDYEACNQHLASKGVILRYLGNSHGSLIESDRERIVYVMTYHSSKGLDFETVFLPGLDENVSIFNRHDEPMERRLFYVAATRSRRNMFISYTGHRPHPFVASMPHDLLEKMPISGASAAGATNQNNDDYY